MEYLADRCAEILDTDISPSTIEKDLADMKRDTPIGYNAPIIYSRQHKGYAYSEVGFSIAELNLQDEEWNGLRFAAQLLFQYRSVPVFADFKQAIERINTRFSLGLDIDEPIISRHVQFESPNSTSGQEWIDLIFAAIRNKHAIEFTYENIYKKKKSNYHLVPYLLKEHRNRWYVIGWNEDQQDYRTYALDRIEALQLISVTQKIRNDFHAEEFFKHATGIMEGNAKPVAVELKISDPISRLILLDPIHPTQEIIKEEKDSVVIKLNVLVNEEFSLKLLGFGPWCVVNKPASLRETMKQLTKKMVENYK